MIKTEEDESYIENEDNNNNNSKTSGKWSIFRICESNPKRSIHRAWSVCILSIMIFFIVSIFEVINLWTEGSSNALLIAALWTAFIQIATAIIGSFIIKRFCTSFSIGFLLGFIVLVAQQNLLVSVAYWGYSENIGGRRSTSLFFSNFAFGLFVVCSAFGIILARYKDFVIVLPMNQNDRNNSSDGGMNA